MINFDTESLLSVNFGRGAGIMGMLACVLLHPSDPLSGRRVPWSHWSVCLGGGEVVDGSREGWKMEGEAWGVITGKTLWCSSEWKPALQCLREPRFAEKTLLQPFFVPYLPSLLMPLCWIVGWADSGAEKLESRLPSGRDQSQQTSGRANKWHVLFAFQPLCVCGVCIRTCV